MVTRSLLKYCDMSSLMKNMSSWSMSWAWIHLIRPTLFVQLQLSCEKSHMYWLPRLASSSDDAKTGQILDLNGGLWSDPTHRKCDYFHRLHRYSLDESRTYQETLNNKFFLRTCKVHSFRMRNCLHSKTWILLKCIWPWTFDFSVLITFVRETAGRLQTIY